VKHENRVTKERNLSICMVLNFQIVVCTYLLPISIVSKNWNAFINFGSCIFFNINSFAWFVVFPTLSCLSLIFFCFLDVCFLSKFRLYIYMSWSYHDIALRSQIHFQKKIGMCFSPKSVNLLLFWFSYKDISHHQSILLNKATFSQDN